MAGARVGHWCDNSEVDMTLYEVIILVLAWIVFVVCILLFAFKLAVWLGEKYRWW